MLLFTTLCFLTFKTICGVWLACGFSKPLTCYNYNKRLPKSPIRRRIAGFFFQISEASLIHCVNWINLELVTAVKQIRLIDTAQRILFEGSNESNLGSFQKFHLIMNYPVAGRRLNTSAACCSQAAVSWTSPEWSFFYSGKTFSHEKCKLFINN